MKRFIAFAGENHGAGGGDFDVLSAHETQENAVNGFGRWAVTSPGFLE